MRVGKAEVIAYFSSLLLPEEAGATVRAAMHHSAMPFPHHDEPGSDADCPAERLLHEQVILLYRHAPSIFFGNLAGGLGIAMMLWDSTPRQQMLLWLLLLSIVTTGRGGLVLLFRGYWRNRLPMLIWGWLFVAGAAASGLVWGLLSLLTFDAGPANLAGIGLVLAGMVAASAPALGAFFPAYLAFAVPAILPFALRCAFTAHSMALGMAVVAAAFLISSLIFGWLNNRTILRSIQLRFDNLELMRRLRDQTTAAEIARQQAESADAAKTRFLAAASHDLRQPLQSVTLLAEALQLERDPQASRRLLDGILEATGSMSELMNELLDYAHIHAGGLQATRSSFDLNALLRRVTAEFQPLAAERGLELRLHERRAVVNSDAGMVERILRNLLSNAIKYTTHGGVLVGLRRRGPHMRVEVWDTGLGIPADRLPDVFSEFYQLDNPERDSRKGLGLGLAIVSSLSGVLDVPLGARSKVGRGSCFSFDLPLDTTRRETGQERPADAPLATGQGTILIIDNEPAILHAMGSLLQAWGFHSIAVESAEDALARLGAPPDAILADFRLREGQTGIDAISQVRAHFAEDIPAALITGDTDPGRLAEARAYGLPLLQKPTPGVALHRLVCQLLGMEAARVPLRA